MAASSSSAHPLAGRRGRHHALLFDRAQPTAIDTALRDPARALRALQASARHPDRPGTLALRRRFAAQLIAEAHERSRARIRDLLAALGLRRRAEPDPADRLIVGAHLDAAAGSMDAWLRDRLTGPQTLTVAACRRQADLVLATRLEQLLADHGADRARWASRLLGARRYRRLSVADVFASGRLDRALAAADWTAVTAAGVREFDAARAWRDGRYAAAARQARQTMRAALCDRLSGLTGVDVAQLAAGGE